MELPAPTSKTWYYDEYADELRKAQASIEAYKALMSTTVAVSPAVGINPVVDGSAIMSVYPYDNVKEFIASRLLTIQEVVDMITFESIPEEDYKKRIKQALGAKT